MLSEVPGSDQALEQLVAMRIAILRPEEGPGDSARNAAIAAHDRYVQENGIELPEVLRSIGIAVGKIREVENG